VADLAGHEVICAGCREYFRPDRLRQDKDAYYCRSCYGILKRKEKICPVCRKVLTPYDPATRDGRFSYCPDCHDRVTRLDRARDAAAGEIADGNARCSECGKSLAPEEARALYANNCYCIACYEKSAPYLDAKPFWLQPGDSVASMRTGREVRCGKCNRDLGPLDVKVRDGKAIYCEKCYQVSRGDPGNRRSNPVEQAGVTVIKDPENLFECGNCGYVVTRDRLREDARGRYVCPKCSKKKMAPMVPASENSKPEKAGPAETEKVDFAVTAQLFKCLGDPCRVKIVESLSEKELCVFEFVDLTGFQYSAISYHLKMLKELGIVQSYERGNFMVYSLTDKGQIVHEFIKKSLELK
jgi:DNA-binding transcriptional ArsR family regulator/formylmethanofuran dehydrogenase subunit E